MKQTREQKAQMMMCAHAIDSGRVAEYKAAGLDVRFANYTRSIEQARAVIAAGLTFDQWLPWRQERWDLSKYDVMTPERIAAYIQRGMSVTDAKREMSRTYPAPMRTR